MLWIWLWFELFAYIQRIDLCVLLIIICLMNGLTGFGVEFIYFECLIYAYVGKIKVCNVVSRIGYGMNYMQTYVFKLMNSSGITESGESEKVLLLMESGARLHTTAYVRWVFLNMHYRAFSSCYQPSVWLPSNPIRKRKK